MPSHETNNTPPTPTQGEHKMHTTPIQGCNAQILGTPTLNHPHTKIWNTIYPTLKNIINQINQNTKQTPTHQIPKNTPPTTTTILWTIDEIIKENINTHKKLHHLKNIKPTWITPITITPTQQNNNYGFTLTWYMNK